MSSIQFNTRIPTAEDLSIFTIGASGRNTVLESQYAGKEELAIGELSISLGRKGSDEREEVFKKKNLITNVSKAKILSGVYLPGIVSDPIVALRVGSGGGIDPQGLFPKPEDANQTDLVTPVLTIPTIYVLSTTNISVKFLADIDQSQSNGTLFTEAGLITASGVLWNIKNHPGIPKTSDFSIHYEWSIRFL